MSSIPDVTIEFVDRPDLLWAYADSITSVTVEGRAVCKVELSAVRWNPSETAINSSAKQYPVCRIAMPLRAMVELQKRLTHLVTQLEGDEAVKQAQKAAKLHVIN